MSHSNSSNSGDREAILGRITEALREEAPRHYETLEKPATNSVTAPFREWLPAVGKTRKDQIALFAKQSEGLKTEFVECTSATAAAKHIAGLAAKKPKWKTIAWHANELVESIVDKFPEGPATLKVDEGYDKLALEACDAAITGCEALIAQTGSVCVTGGSSGGRALSVLPPHHIVIAQKAQVVADLPAAFELLAQKYQGKYPSFISFITGPSRTGDIERILVLGAHGPKKLTVLLLP
jgi:L-lactate dehydrogenase complex protein LldG